MGQHRAATDAGLAFLPPPAAPAAPAGPACGQHGCGARAAYRYTWPGRDETHVCDAHAPKLRAVAAALGLHVQLIPLE